MTIKKELEDILDKITSSPFNLQELSQLYFKAKSKVFANEEGITESEGLISITIFMEGYARTATYLSKKKLTDLTDQELEILLNLSAEASVNFDYLTELFSDGENGRMSAVFSSKSNERHQAELKQLREKVIREQVERKFRQDNNNDSKNQRNTKINGEINTLLDKDAQTRIAELEKELNFLKKQGKTKEADRLQARIDILKNMDNSEQSPKSPNLGKGKKLFFGVLIFIGVILLGFFLFSKAKEKIGN